MGIGKQIRLTKLKNEYGFYFFLAADHRLSSGRVAQLDNILHWIRLVDSAPALSGIVLNVGSLRSVPPTFTKEVIPQVMGGPNPSGQNLLKKQVGSVTESLRFGANLISTQINFEEASFLEQIDYFQRIRHSAAEIDLPVLIMINLKDRQGFDVERFFNFLTYASELGGDIVKINLPTDAASNVPRIKEYLSQLPPVILSGDAKGAGFLESVALCKMCGFAGLCVGRNIFMDDNPQNVVTDTCNTYMTTSS